MNNFTGISDTSLVLTSLLLLISIFFSYYQKLHLEKEIIISIIRAVIQLLVIGYILTFIFSVDSPYFTALLLLSMITNAAYNAKKRGEGIKNAFLISFIAVLFGACITLGILVLTKSLKFTAYQVIPVGGMITGNAMVVRFKDDKIHNEYLMQLLSWTKMDNVITGSAQPQITRTNLAPLKILIPKNNILDNFSQKMEFNINLQLKNIEQNQELAKLRDWLLPMLMNGQVKVEI